MSQPLYWTLLLVGLAHLLSSCELLAARKLFGPEARCCWSLLSQKFPERLARLLQPLGGHPGVLALLALRASSGLWLICCPSSWAALVSLTVLTIVLHARNRPWMVDAGDKFLLMVTLGLLLAGLPTQSVLSAEPALESVALIFIAAQASLSYFTAGFYKMRNRWGNGRFLSDLLDCQLLVGRTHATFLKRYSWLLPLMETSVVTIQLMAPALVLMGPTCAKVLVLWSFTFHLLGAWGLGLRTFSQAYWTCYPAILWCAAR